MKEQFIGVWKLVSYTYQNENGETRTPFGENPKGIIMYDASGYMAVQIMTNDRPHFTVNDILAGTPDEIKAAFEGLNTYYGPYTINEAESIVTHHLEGASLPNREGSDQIRAFSFSDDGQHLTLKAKPRLIGGEMLIGVLLWGRIPSN